MRARGEWGIPATVKRASINLTEERAASVLEPQAGLTTVALNQYAFLLLKMRSKVIVMICKSKVRLQLRR
jgi:hypothetical protein